MQVKFIEDWGLARKILPDLIEGVEIKLNPERIRVWERNVILPENRLN